MSELDEAAGVKRQRQGLEDIPANCAINTSPLLKCPSEILRMIAMQLMPKKPCFVYINLRPEGEPLQSMIVRIGDQQAALFQLGLSCSSLHKETLPLLYLRGTAVFYFLEPPYDPFQEGWYELDRNKIIRGSHPSHSVRLGLIEAAILAPSTALLMPLPELSWGVRLRLLWFSLECLLPEFIPSGEHQDIDASELQNIKDVLEPFWLQVSSRCAAHVYDCGWVPDEVANWAIDLERRRRIKFGVSHMHRDDA